MNNQFLQDKKILFIGPKFNGYENEIIAALRSKGAHVDFFLEKINSLTAHYITKFSRMVGNRIQANHMDNILNNVQAEYDYLFVIRGETLSPDFFDQLFQRSKINHKMMYQWDSVRATPNIMNIAKNFDKIYSFDYEDCQQRNFKYLPLFYINAFVDNQHIKPIYDFSFIGQFHSDRHKYLIDIKKFAKERNLSVNFKMKMTPLRFVQKKLFDKSFKDISIQDVIFKNISLEQVSLIVKKSKILIDVVNTLQSGLSIRTFEVLGADRKLLTNNKNIQNEKFYNPNCICMIENVNDEFIKSKCHIDNFQEYSIDGWLDKLFQYVDVVYE